MFFDMHMDIWTNATWEYEKGNKDIIRKKFKNRDLVVYWKSKEYCF